MKNIHYVIVISVLGIIILYSCLFFYSESAKCEAEIRAASEAEKNAEEIFSAVAKRNSPVRTNEADLVRICAEITKTKRQSDLTVYETTEESTEETIEETSEEKQDENLAFWLSKAADFNASEEIVTFLYETMKAAGIEQMMRFGMAQIFQESRFTITAENQQNHLDMGILQYRITYWSAVCKEHGFPEDTSIFDWQTQIRIYTQDMARRLASGLSIEETISRHKTSDYGTYDAVYVEQVMRWVR